MKPADLLARGRLYAALLITACLGFAAPANLVRVESKRVSRLVSLPGDLQPYETVAVHARVRGYVEQVLVDRGSVVKKGQLLLRIAAPELEAQVAEAESRFRAAESDRAAAVAQLAAAESTSDRLRKASETTGAIAGNELIQTSRQVEAARALVQSKAGAVSAAMEAARAQRELAAYLRVAAPFSGVVTERMVHPGALVGPDAASPLVTIQQLSRLRLVVSLPEEYAGHLQTGIKVPFHVPAFPGRSFNGVVARIAHSLNDQTRTMPIELEVTNQNGSLAPGMYATVAWPFEHTSPSLLVPKTAVVTTAERVFVVRDRGGRAQWVDVRKGEADGDQVEILPVKPGTLTVGDRVLRRATDEFRDGASLQE